LHIDQLLQLSDWSIPVRIEQQYPNMAPHSSHDEVIIVPRVLLDRYASRTCDQHHQLPSYISLTPVTASSFHPSPTSSPKLPLRPTALYTLLKNP
jgi:hypothetical protein